MGMPAAGSRWNGGTWPGRQNEEVNDVETHSNVVDFKPEEHVSYKHTREQLVSGSLHSPGLA